MGFFTRFFRRKEQLVINENKETGTENTVEVESPVVMAEKNAQMEAAYEQARASFKYLWRELSWEHRRIIPAHSMACVKVPFSQGVDGQKTPYVEHLWMKDIYFDGEKIYGTVLNQPNVLTNVQAGDQTEIGLEEISDWILGINGKVYGAFTVQLLRKSMDPAQRDAHDSAWGLDFGDPNTIEIVYQQKEHPENLIEHPMSINMQEKLLEFLKSNPEEVTQPDDSGYTALHRETIAGNRSSVETLLQLGADTQAKNEHGKTALDYAKALNWEQLIPLLEKNT